VAAKTRLDAELVRRGLARSREHAHELVDSGRVRIAGLVATKSATGVDPAAAVSVDATGRGGEDYVSRGGRKLAGALDALAADLPAAGHRGPLVNGRRCLDVGASTGGFTDVLLRRGAREVVAVDVGYGQLAWSLRTDPRVAVHERTNARSLTAEDIGGPVDLVVGDVSFISLRLVLPALVACTNPAGEMLLLVKPQFEAGREQVGRGGVVRDLAVRAAAVRDVASAAADLGWGSAGVTASPLPGPAGNVEFFLWLRRDSPALDEQALRDAVMPGPVAGVRDD
jgi:23S rRNA (cytidine1920-2'-O)/16S rRNA (cytidine1409-2'-O)-methyltransferase